MCSSLPGWIQGPLDWLQRLNPFVSHNQSPEKKPEATPADTPEKPETAAQEEQSEKPPEPVILPKPMEIATSIEHGLALLKAEWCKLLEEKAQRLNGLTKELHAKIKSIDDLLCLISQYSQKNPDGTENTSGNVDCTNPAIANLVADLRKKGVAVPLPDGTLNRGERGNVVNNLANERNLLNDELKEHSQEFQQCAMERNSLFQSLNALISELHRLKVKILGHIQRSAS
jgi:hypothetical protein